MSTLIKFIIIFFSMPLLGCYYDHEEILYPESKCTVPASSSFTGHVLPLLNSKCNSCHGGVSPSGNISLTTHTEVMKYVNNGSLMGSINHVSSYSPMPKNSTKMSACEIETIQKWIDAGALNN